VVDCFCQIEKAEKRRISYEIYFNSDYIAK
jgi:hypothetical protein